MLFNSKKNIEYSEEELLEMLKGKKREQEKAFAYIYNKYSQRIYAYCVRVTSTTEDANDIFQDAFFNFVKKAKKTNDLSNIPGLLLTITRNLCLNYKRDKRSSC